MQIYNGWNRSRVPCVLCYLHEHREHRIVKDENIGLMELENVSFLYSSYMVPQVAKM